MAECAAPIRSLGPSARCVLPPGHSGRHMAIIEGVKRYGGDPTCMATDDRDRQCQLDHGHSGAHKFPRE
jgi:hypothetical protein